MAADRRGMLLGGARRLTGVLRAQHGRRVPCPDSACRAAGGALVLKRGAGRWFWGCTRYPVCRESHSADQQTGGPLGTPADSVTRLARVRVHKELEAWCADEFQSRARGYLRLAGLLGIPAERCHVSMFTLEQCRAAERAITEARRLDAQAWKQTRAPRKARPLAEPKLQPGPQWKSSIEGAGCSAVTAKKRRVVLED